MIKLYGPDDKIMMTVDSLQQEDNMLVIKAKIYDAMPLTAQLRPEDARAFIKMLTPKLWWFLITLPFRSSRKQSSQQS